MQNTIIYGGLYMHVFYDILSYNVLYMQYMILYRRSYIYEKYDKLTRVAYGLVQ